jgi:uncharacterized protein
MKRLVLLLFLIFLVSCGSELSTLTITTSTGEVDVIVEVADTLDEQTLGLMYRTEMEADHGMLFVFEGLEQRTFWMKNTDLVLDIFFVDSEWTIVDIKENFEPCNYEPCEFYTSKPAMYALEVNGGYAVENGIEIGNNMILNN